MADSIFSQRLTMLRKQKGWKQGDVAEMLGLSRSSYTCYETGKSLPGALTLCKLGDMFEVSLDYLLGRGEDPSLFDVPDSTRRGQETRLMDLFRLMDDNARQVLLGSADLMTKHLQKK